MSWRGDRVGEIPDTCRDKPGVELAEKCAISPLAANVIVAKITLFAHPCDSSPANPGQEEEVAQSARHTSANVYVKRILIRYVTAYF